MSHETETSREAVRSSEGPGQATVRTSDAQASAGVGFEADWEAACDAAIGGLELVEAPDLLLVFVDSMKELPMTLILRPFNYETLATNVYQFASDELLEECALSALSIVLAGVLPVLLLTRIIGHSRAGEELIPRQADQR